MRSSIACARCRRSKVKCINAGVDTICRACEANGRECTYPAPVSSGGGGGAKRESAGACDGARDVKRHRPKKSATGVPMEGLNTGAGSRQSARAYSNALDPTVVTPKIWQEVFDIFQLHFSTDLPFFHPPTFLAPIRRAIMPLPNHTSSNQATQTPNLAPPVSPLLLLGILALTARFHPAIAAYHSPATPNQPTNPLLASEYYTAALRARIAGPDGEALARPSIERIQAMLMLGLHEWGMCQGIRAWLIVGIAVRTSQAMGLEYEQELDNDRLALSSALSTEAEHLGVAANRRGSRETGTNQGQSFVAEEVRRRTFWSCFIMDRYLSSGKYRPQMIAVKDLRVQLPSSEKAFLFGERMRTTLLGQDAGDGARMTQKDNQGRTDTLDAQEAGSAKTDHHHRPKEEGSSGQPSSVIEGQDQGKWELGAEEGILSRVVKLVDIWGKIAKWSCAGGRRYCPYSRLTGGEVADHHRTEQYPPWQSQSTFASLRSLLKQFHAHLPRQLEFTIANVEAHIAWKSSTPYTVMHTIYFLCLIVLHREYVPFIPIRCPKPQGPLDEPTFPPEKYDVPNGFWDESAREMFKAARDMMDLVRTCQEWNSLVETPMVGFAIYTVAFVGVYALYFPLMDPHGYMCTPSSVTKDDAQSEDSGGQQEARRAIQIIGHMTPRLRMAEGWLRTIGLMHRYYDKIINDYKRNTRALVETSGPEEQGRPPFRRPLTLREGGLGGGLEEYKLLEKTLKEFGDLQDEDVYSTDGEEPTKRGVSPVGTANSEGGSNAMKSDGPECMGHAGESEATRRDGWAAVNIVVPSPQASQTPDLVDTTNTMPAASPYAPSRPPVPESPRASVPPYPYNSSLHTSCHYQPAPAASPTSPSLVSPGSHTASTSSFASPYSRPEYLSQQQQTPNQPTYPYQPSQTYASIMHPHPPTSLSQQNTPNGPAPTSSNNDRPAISNSNSDPGGCWNVEAKESWLNSLHTRFGGDDVAAFVDGSSWEDWAAMAGSSTGGVGGWLSTVWGAGARDVRM